jgi:hypothetical protein
VWIWAVRKTAQPLDIGTSVWVPALLWETGKGTRGASALKAKGQSSAGRKVPSSGAFSDEASWPTSVGWEVVDRRADGEAIGRKPVVVLEELGQVIARLFKVCRNHGETCDVRSLASSSA